jgi:Sushi repeat (SCR repeat)
MSKLLFNSRPYSSFLISDATNTCHLCFLLVFGVAVNCSSLNVTNASVNTTAVVYSTYVNISCQAGYQIGNNQYWIVIQCQASKTWSTQSVNCTGK